MFDALASFPDALLLAGGTDSMVLVNAGVLRPDNVISLRNVQELKIWNSTFIGSGVTYARLEHSETEALVFSIGESFPASTLFETVSKDFRERSNNSFDNSNFS